MKSATKSNLIAIAIIIPVAVILSALMQFSIDTAKKGRLEERFATLVQSVDDRCEETDYFALERDKDWKEEYTWYKDSLVYYTERIDTRYNVFAAIYDSERKAVDAVNNIEERVEEEAIEDEISGWEGDAASSRHATIPGHPFDPWAYDDVIRAVRVQYRGIENVVFSFLNEKTDKTIKRPIRLYFRRVPSGATEDYLTIMVGIPFTTDNAEISKELRTLIISVFMLAIIACSLLIFCGTKYLARYGDLTTVLKNLDPKNDGENK
ncbi:hypothetical protein FACS189447_03520 [Spirochaetia bacterium]|nr:hypothetical protein FACS189447_03520 [Spirochaetia bacterium]